MEAIGREHLDTKYTFLSGSYFNKVNISLRDVSEEELIKILGIIEQDVYWFGLLGYHRSYRKIDAKTNEELITGDYYHNIKNKVRLEKSKGLVNIFIKCPTAETIEKEILELIPKEGIESKVE